MDSKRLTALSGNSLCTRALTLTAAAILALAGATASKAEPEFKVGFLAGGDRENNFWVRMGQFAEAVAEDLNIDLQIKYPSPATYVIKRSGEKLIDSLDDDSYLITVYFDAVTSDLLQAAELQKVRTFIVNTDILDQDREAVGTPRQKYRQWIGHMRPDDVQAGYLVADEILRHFDDPNDVNMIGVNGDPSVQVAVDRETGLKERLSQSPGATLHKIGTADWLKESAVVTTGDLLEQYPDTNAIWAASDPMAMGAIQAVEQAGLEPGRDVVIASVDWTNEGLRAVQAGDMLATVGGHFMEAGIALMLIYDYHNNRDFADELGTGFKTSMYAVTQKDVDRYFERIGANPDWSAIDFRQFTKTHNPDLERYDFSWSTISDQLK